MGRGSGLRTVHRTNTAVSISSNRPQPRGCEHPVCTPTPKTRNAPPIPGEAFLQVFVFQRFTK